MRNMSFMLTKAQFRNRSKSVTRRLGWWFLKPGDVVMGCEKCQGLKPGEKLVKLGPIRIVSTKGERLDSMLVQPYGKQEAIKEGFPKLDGAGFVSMFCEHMSCIESEVVNRIEFDHPFDIGKRLVVVYPNGRRVVTRVCQGVIGLNDSWVSTGFGTFNLKSMRYIADESIRLEIPVKEETR